MKRSMFGDPRPLGVAEIEEATQETGMEVRSARVLVAYGDDGYGNSGWCADVSGDCEDEMVEFGTLAYPTRDALIADLRHAGFWPDQIEVEAPAA